MSAGRCTDEFVCSFYWGEGNYSTIEPERNCSYGFETDLMAVYKQIKKQFIDKGIPCLMGEYSTQRWTETRNKFVPKEMDKHNKSVDDWITFNTSNVKRLELLHFIGKQAELLTELIM
jgi:hypothetical protein